MGLDTYAVQIKTERAPDEDFNGIQLCGGMFSGGGSSFRGKVYARAIEDATGVSLYQDVIMPETIQEMYKELADARPELEADIGREDTDNLIAFFKVCAEKGYGLVGWW